MMGNTKLYIFVTHDILRTYMFFDHGGGGSLGFLTFFLNQVTYRPSTLGKFRGDQLKKITLYIPSSRSVQQRR